MVESSVKGATKQSMDDLMQEATELFKTDEPIRSFDKLQEIRRRVTEEGVTVPAVLKFIDSDEMKILTEDVRVL